MNQPLHQVESPWPHRWAVALVCATFPMIWIGGLVTTTGSGMAVPDWPTTYGYNPFSYPLETWIYGPWKLFIEHGHRLFGTVVGMVAIAFLASTWWCQRRSLIRWLGFAALAGVLFQGVLGGMRVLANEVLLAQIHGCVGPAFFGFTIALAVVTSRRWREAEPSNVPAISKIERLALITAFLAFLQIVIGSQLRHLPAVARPGEFRMALFFHLFIAATLWAHIGMLMVRIWRGFRQNSWLVRPAVALSVLVVLQIVLGLGTWVTKYGFPGWMAGYEFAAAFRPTADAPWQISITTAHVAIGSMLFGNSVALAMRTYRLVGREEVSTSATRSRGTNDHGRTLLMEVAR